MRGTPDEDNGADDENPGARLKQLFDSFAEEARDFTRRKPLEGLLLSFIAGLVLGNLLRRNR